MTLARAIIAYLGGLELAVGDHDGEPFTVLPWESRFIRGAFGTDGDSSLSVGRGNGKSALVAALACAVVDPDGPLHGRRREVVCAASSFAQGRIIYEDCVAMMREKNRAPAPGLAMARQRELRAPRASCERGAYSLHRERPQARARPAPGPSAAG